MADDDDGDDGDDGDDDGEEGEEGDEEDSEMPDGESGAGPLADNETKPDPMPEVPPTVLQTESADTPPIEVPVAVAPLPVKQPSPPFDAALAATQSHIPHLPSHFEGSPLKNVVAIASPTGPLPLPNPILDDVLNDGNSLDSITTTETKLPEAPLEPIPASTELVKLPSPVNGPITTAPAAPAAPTAVAPAPASPIITIPIPSAPTTTMLNEDIEMLDASHQVHEEATAGQEIQQSNVTELVSLPALDPIPTEDVLTAVQSPPRTMVLEAVVTDQPIEEAVHSTVVSMSTDQEPQEPQGPEVPVVAVEADVAVTVDADTAPAPAPAPAPASDSAPALDPIPAPEKLDTVVDLAAVIGGVEDTEPEPESPDLFSGLEAALNQQGSPKDGQSLPGAEANNIPSVE